MTRDVSYAYARRLYASENRTPSPTLRQYVTVARGNSETPPDPSLQARVSTIEQKLDKMILLLDRFLQLHAAGDSGSIQGHAGQNQSQEQPPRSGQQEGYGREQQERPVKVVVPEMTDATQSQPHTNQGDDHDIPEMMDSHSQPLTASSQDTSSSISPPPVRNPLTEPLPDNWDSTSQESARQSWRQQDLQDSAAQQISDNHQDQPSTSRLSAQDGIAPSDGVSPSPQIGHRRQGGTAGRHKRMPSLTRQPRAPT